MTNTLVVVESVFKYNDYITGFFSECFLIKTALLEKITNINELRKMANLSVRLDFKKDGTRFYNNNNDEILELKCDSVHHIRHILVNVNYNYSNNSYISFNYDNYFENTLKGDFKYTIQIYDDFPHRYTVDCVFLLREEHGDNELFAFLPGTKYLNNDHEFYEEYHGHYNYDFFPECVDDYKNITLYKYAPRSVFIGL